jgi:ABC-type lipoprotein export system ATPase subunit
MTADDSIWARPAELPTETAVPAEVGIEDADDRTWAPRLEKTDSPVTTPMATSSGAVLSASGVTRTFKRGAEEIPALKGIDLDLLRGELVALVGRSGSGKTTMLNVLCGWEIPDTGTVSWNGTTPKVGEVGWSGMALVPQSSGLLEDLTVAENVGLPSRMRGDSAAQTRAILEDLLDSLGIGHLADRLPNEISLGEQQRTSVARALILEPDLLLADEPTAHQDAVSMQKVIDAIRAVVDSGRACLVASHNSEILKAADKVLEISDGRLISR